jgi:hypothetical protein
LAPSGGEFGEELVPGMNQLLVAGGGVGHQSDFLTELLSADEA